MIEKIKTKVKDFMNKPNRKLILSFTVGLVILLGVFSFISFGNGIKQGTNKPIIALVNEDSATNFNGKTYNFGNDFATQVSHDDKYNWQVVSRSVAERAYADKQVDAVVYIQQSFSHNILTLQDLNPQQSEVDYKIQSSNSLVSQTQLDNKIGNALQGFNTSVVKMYYSSVAGNVADAQNNMNTVVGNQSDLVNGLSNNVRPSFVTANSGYGSVISTSDMLKGQNSEWIQETNSFTKATQDNLNSTSHSLSGTLPGVNGLFNDLTLMGQTNVANGNASMLEQRNNDFTTFQNYLTPLNNGLNGFDEKYANLKNNLDLYNSYIGTTLVGDLTTQRNQLLDPSTGTGAISDLQDLEQQMLEKYGNQNVTSIDETNNGTITYSESDAANAMAHIMYDSLDGHSKTVDQYITQLDNLISQISVDPTQNNALLNAIGPKGSGALTQLRIDEYNKALAIIQAYAGSTNTAAPTLTLGSNQTIKLPEQTINVASGNTYSVDSKNLAVTPTYTLNGGNSSAVTVSGSKLTIDNRPTGSNPNPTVSIKITYTINIDKMNGQTLGGFSDSLGNKFTNDTLVFSTNPQNSTDQALGNTQFQEITDYLGKIDTAINLLNFLYGAPNDSVGSFEKNMDGKTDFAGYNPNSVYNRYDSISPDAIVSHLQAVDSNNDPLFDSSGNPVWKPEVTQFYQTGQEQINKVVDSLNNLYDNQKRLNTDITDLSNSKLPDNFFSGNISDLDNWYATTMAYITDSTNQWNSNKMDVNLTTKEWKDKDGNIHNIYTDQTDGDALYQTISSLMKSTSQSATETANAAKMIKDNSNQFEQMVQTVQTTKADAQKVLDTTDASIKNGQTGLKASQNYNNKFGQTLANTRNPNANQNKLFDFFAQPISIKNIGNLLSAQGFDWRWLLMLGIGIMIGALSVLSSRLVKKGNNK